MVIGLGEGTFTFMGDRYTGSKLKDIPLPLYQRTFSTLLSSLKSQKQKTTHILVLMSLQYYTGREAMLESGYTLSGSYLTKLQVPTKFGKFCK